MTDELPLFANMEEQPLSEFTEKAYLDYSMYVILDRACLLYTSPSPRDLSTSRMPSSA